MTAPPELLYDPPSIDNGQDDGDEDPQLVIMVSILDGRTDEMRSSRIALPLPCSPSSMVDALLDGTRAAAAAHSATLHSMLADRMSTLGAPAAAGITVSMLDQLAAHGHQAHGGPPVSVQVPGYPHPVPFDVARAVLVAAGAW